MSLHRSVSCTVIFGTALLLTPPPQAQAKILAQWVELGPDGSSSARAITDDAACPAVRFDGVAVPMNVALRSPDKTSAMSSRRTFPVRGCEVAVPAGAVSACSTASRCRCRGPIRSAS